MIRLAEKSDEAGDSQRLLQESLRPAQAERQGPDAVMHPYLHFLSANLRSLQQKHPGMDAPGLTQVAMAAWDALPEEEKQAHYFQQRLPGAVSREEQAPGGDTGASTLGAYLELYNEARLESRCLKQMQHLKLKDLALQIDRLSQEVRQAGEQTKAGFSEQLAEVQRSLSVISRLEEG